MEKSKSVDEYIEHNEDRQLELIKLRKILLSLPFQECIKWGMPTYTVGGKNVVGIGSFKEWSCLWFHQGAFLKDKSQVLENAQEGKTKGMRQWRFSSVEDIDADLVRLYLEESIENQLAGKEIKPAKKANKRIQPPELLADYLSKNLDHLKTFQSYTTSQKNEFSNYIIDAKRQKTKLDRLEKIKDLLENKKTLNALWGG
jgi:uncharacterized protein YdeI (YjbR/CyaY-like superfamily)